MHICKCGGEMRCTKTGRMVILQCLKEEKQVVRGDEFTCPNCESAVVLNCAGGTYWVKETDPGTIVMKGRKWINQQKVYLQHTNTQD